MFNLSGSDYEDVTRTVRRNQTRGKKPRRKSARHSRLKEYPGTATARVIGLAAPAAAEIQEKADIPDAPDRVRYKDFCRVTGKPLEQAEREFTAEPWLIGDDQIRGSAPGPHRGRRPLWGVMENWNCTGSPRDAVSLYTVRN
ncbi:MAG: hypothetical protein LBD47_03210 [Treponema sp.]|nr:hypothetical protein [Treponema sp.]